MRLFEKFAKQHFEPAVYSLHLKTGALPGIAHLWKGDKHRAPSNLADSKWVFFPINQLSTSRTFAHSAQALQSMYLNNRTYVLIYFSLVVPLRVQDKNPVKFLVRDLVYPQAAKWEKGAVVGVYLVHSDIIFSSKVTFQRNLTQTFSLCTQFSSACSFWKHVLTRLECCCSAAAVFSRSCGCFEQPRLQREQSNTVRWSISCISDTCMIPSCHWGRNHKRRRNAAVTLSARPPHTTESCVRMKRAARRRRRGPPSSPHPPVVRGGEDEGSRPPLIINGNKGR